MSARIEGQMEATRSGEAARPCHTAGSCDHIPPGPARAARGLGVALLTTALPLLAGGAAFADDTEIFVQALPPGKPNVLLILDTSGSMAAEVVVSDDYDPSQQYAGACAADRLYYSRQSNRVQIPDCGADPLLYVNQPAVFCEAATNGLDVAGYFTDRYAQWDENTMQWGSLTAATMGDPPGEARALECASDFGLHGDGADADAVYPVASPGEDSGPWTASEADAIDWLGEDVYTLYSANYLNWLSGAREERVSTRMQVLKDVSEAILASLAGIRVGVMRFSSDGEGGMVVHPVVDLSEPGSRASVLSTIDTLQPGGGTPLAESLWEAQRYLSGSAVDFGLQSRGNDDVLQPSVASSRNGDIYLSPIDQQCQANYAVLLTDGLPNGDTQADSRIEALTGTACAGSCLDELSNWLATTDQSATHEGEQSVQTFTIGFFTDDQLLRDTATARRPDGSIGYYTADDLLQLSDALRRVIEDIEERNSSFQSPALAIDGFNRLVNSDELYFSMFIPSARPHWSGNIKKYGLAEIGDAMRIVDADGNPAVDTDGTFFDDARSFWSSDIDGADVKRGGARNRLGLDRRIFTDPAFAGQEVDLWLPQNRFSEDNDLITAAMLNVAESERDTLIRFVRGIDESGDPNPMFGDPLHSNPTLVNFADDGGGTRLKMFVTTNDGVFHALDVQPDTEAEALEDFAFIPAQMLPRLWRVLDNEADNPSRKGYGLDGPISYWISNDDGDRVVESGETLYVYFAMRRGGRNYYAIRIPGDRPDQPTLAWTLRGGVGAFDELGQSWSAATVARMRYGEGSRTVLVIGGGYDADSQDPVGPRRKDAMGRAIFIVDAETGQRLWWVSNPDAGTAGDPPDLALADMTNSIPSDVAVIDSGGDGLGDRLYVGDTGGRVWRFDVGDLAAGEVNGAVLADLGTSAESDNLRFYYKPSVSRVLDQRYGSFLTVAIGSGHRASPLDTTVSDRFFMLRDPYIFAPPRDENGEIRYPPPITEASLLDITDDTTPTAPALNARRGWVLRLTAQGEKSLSAPLTADNRIFFSTYLPQGGFQPTCNLSGVLGGGRLYQVNLVSGAPVLLEDPIDDGLPPPEERYTTMEAGGIPPSPRLIFTECDGDCLSRTPPPEPSDLPEEGGSEGGSGRGCENPFSQVTLLMGTQATNPGICNAPVRTFWRQNRRR